jgi:prophage regulatory protein
MTPGSMTDTGTARPAPASGERLLRLPQVLALTGRGRTATLDDVRTGRFPAAIKIGSAALWLESEVQAWIADRIAAHRGGPKQ